MRLPCRAFLLAILVVVCLPGYAQYSIQAISIRGGAPYTDAEINAVDGLQAGQLLSQRSLANAAQHLLDTGMFADAEVSLSGQGKARTVEILLKLTPSDQLLPASLKTLSGGRRRG